MFLGFSSTLEHTTGVNHIIIILSFHETSTCQKKNITLI